MSLSEYYNFLIENSLVLKKLIKTHILHQLKKIYFRAKDSF